jgi:hypothetical protein
MRKPKGGRTGRRWLRNIKLQVKEENVGWMQLLGWLVIEVVQ